MTEFTLSPTPEWATDPAIARHAYKGDWSDPAARSAFYARYDSRDAALVAAEKAGLFPSTEVYGTGRTVIYVAPVEFGGIENATLETRHDRARVSGIYR